MKRFFNSRSSFSIIRSIHVEKNIEKLGLKMPTPSVPKGSFIQYNKIGNLVFVSGHLPQPADGPLIVGKVGKDTTVEQGYEAAKMCALNICSTLKHNLGDLDKVKKVVKVLGFVNCIDTFTQQPSVVNGTSEFFVKVFGNEIGAHTRSAVGTNSLPLGVPVEVEAIFEVEQ